MSRNRNYIPRIFPRCGGAFSGDRHLCKRCRSRKAKKKAKTVSFQRKLSKQPIEYIIRRAHAIHSYLQLVIMGANIGR